MGWVTALGSALGSAAGGSAAAGAAGGAGAAGAGAGLGAAGAGAGGAAGAAGAGAGGMLGGAMNGLYGLGNAAGAAYAGDWAKAAGEAAGGMQQLGQAAQQSKGIKDLIGTATKRGEQDMQGMVQAGMSGMHNPGYQDISQQNGMGSLMQMIGGLSQNSEELPFQQFMRRR